MEILVLDSPLNNSHYVISYLHGIFDRLERIHTYVACGSSSIIALLLNVGLTPKEINSALLNTNIFDGCYDGSQLADLDIRTVLREIVFNFYGIIPTLLQLKELTNKTLYLSSYNDSLQQVEYFSAGTHPELDCITACTFAYNFPYKCFARTYCGNLYVDASYKDPLPIGIVKDKSNILCIYTTIKPVELIISDNNDMSRHYRYLLFSSLNTYKNFLASTLKKDCVIVKLELDYYFENPNIREKIAMAHRGARKGS